MKTGSIPHPRNVYYLAIRPEYLAMTDNDECGAAILNLFEFWYEADKALADTDAPTSGTIHISIAKLRDRLLRLWGKEKIQKQLNVLQERRYILKWAAKKSYDRRPFYTFNAKLVSETILAWIEGQETAPADISRNQSMDALESVNGSTETSQSISIDSSIDSFTFSEPDGSEQNPASPSLASKSNEAKPKTVVQKSNGSVQDSDLEASHSPKRPTIVQPLNEAVALHIQGIEPKLAGRVTGQLAQTIADVWRRKLETKRLTAEDYQMIAQTVEPFVKAFKQSGGGEIKFILYPAGLENWYTRLLPIVLKTPAAVSPDDELVPDPDYPGTGKMTTRKDAERKLQLEREAQARHGQ